MTNSKKSPGKVNALFGSSRTNWSRLARLRTAQEDEKRKLLDVISRCYWGPLHKYARLQWRRSSDDAQDDVQEFFAHAFRTDFFAKADQTKGRFRSFLLGSFHNFLCNERRKQKVRRPPGGAVHVDELTEKDLAHSNMRERETPEGQFHYAWVRRTIETVAKELEAQLHQEKRAPYFEAFAARTLNPALYGVPQASTDELVARHQVEYNIISNRMTTARRKFEELLQKHIGQYARSKEDAAAEKDDVFRYLIWDSRA